MSISEWKTLVAILDKHEDALVEDALEDLPTAVRALNPQVTFECTHSGIRRWVVFGAEGKQEWLELCSLSLEELDERLNDEEPDSSS